MAQHQHQQPTVSLARSLQRCTTQGETIRTDPYVTYLLTYLPRSKLFVGGLSWDTTDGISYSLPIRYIPLTITRGPKRLL